MITAEIKIHTEPAPYQHTENYSNSYSNYSLMSTNQKSMFDIEHKAELEKAKKIYQIGDLVKLKARNQVVEITEFVENPVEVIIFATKMCIIYGQYLDSKANTDLRYALHELDETTIIRPETKQLPVIIQGANDGLC